MDLKPFVLKTYCAHYENYLNPVTLLVIACDIL